jgi:hypothetical protein
MGDGKEIDYMVAREVGRKMGKGTVDMGSK